MKKVMLYLKNNGPWLWIVLWSVTPFVYVYSSNLQTFLTLPITWPIQLFSSLIGAFSGAYCAFYFNNKLQYIAREREEIAAGRRALFTIRSQMDDFLNYRRAIRHSINLLGNLGWDGPEWLYAKPMGFNFNPSTVFDYKSLSFILSKPLGRRAYQSLQVCERAYLDLMARHTDLNSSAIDLQKVLAQLEQSNADFNQWSIQTLGTRLTLELRSRVGDHLKAVVLRTDRDEPMYSNAFNELSEVMKDIFGDVAEMPPHTIPNKFKKENLPKMPSKFIAYLQQVPIDNQDE